MRAALVLVILPGLAVPGGSGSAPVPSPGLRLTSTTDPTPPTNVVAASADRALNVSWTASTELTTSGYQVYLGNTLVASPTASPVSLSGLVNGQSYVVTVRTVSSVLGTTYVGTTASTPVTGTPRDSVVPAAPTGVSAARGDRQVTVTWTANSADYDADGYRVLRDGVAVSGLLSGRSTVSYVDTGLTNDTTYGYTVQTHDTSGNWSVSSSPVAFATPTDLTPPAVPSGLAAARGDGRVTLSWTANTEPDLASYRVLRAGVEIATVPAGTTTYLDTTVTNDSAYSYSLVAVDTHGNRSAASTAVSATPTDLTPPAVPSGLAAARGDGRVTLSWSADTEPDLASYRVLRGGVEITTVPAGTTTYTNTGLTNDTAYSYSLVAVDTHGNRSAASPAVSATPTDLTPPAAPTGLVPTGGDRQVTLSWTANTEPDLASYRVLRGGVEIATVPAGTTTYTNTGLTNDTAYSYSLVAVDTHGNRSAASPAVSATPTDLTPPAAPTGLVPTGGDRQVTLSWTANTEPDLASYRVLRGGVEIATVPAGTTTYLDTGLTNGTSYSYTLVAVDTSGNRSTPSSPTSATAGDWVPPAAPTGLTAQAGDGRVTLSWTANTEPDLASYRVLRGGVEIATVPAGTTTYANTGLTNDVTYSYSLVAVDTSGNRSAASTAVPATPTDLTPPAAPTGLVATGGDAQVALSWTANTEPDLASYRVLRGGVEIATVPAGTTYTDTGLPNGSAYSYSLVAVDTHGNRSAASTAVSATPTDLTPPAGPTGVVATGGDRQVSLSWTANAEPDLTSYRVLRGSTEIATVPAGTTTYTDTGLTNGTSYTYALVAVDTAGNRSVASSATSATAGDWVPPAAPTGLTAQAGDGRITLSWTANTEPDLASYRVLRGGVEIATVPAGTTYTDTTVTNDVTYSYTLVAVDTSGNRSAASPAVSAIPTDLTAPAVPTGLAAARGDGRVSLSWAANGEPDLASYAVLRGGAEIAGVPAGTTTYSDSGLTNDTAYSYSLVAVDTHGNRSAASPAVSAIPTDLTAPAVPTGLAAARGDGRVSLSWAANGEPDLASYAVLRGGSEIATVPGGTTSYVDTTVTNDVTYSYSLVAVDTSANRSAASAAVSAIPTDLTAPAAPTGLAAQAGDGRVTLSWSANGEPDLASYAVLRGGTEIATVTAGTTYVDTTVTNGTAYSYSLVAVDTHGNRSAASTAVPATPTDLTPPAAPTGLAAQAGDGRVNLSWAANAEPDLASYRVLRGGTEIATVPAGITYTDTGLTNGTAYSYTLVAVDTSGNRSTASTAVTATPTGAPQKVPAQGAGQKGGLATSSDGRYVVVGTSAPLESSDTNTAYELYLVDRSAHTSRRIAALPAGATGASDSTNTSAPAISDDGRYVALATTAALVPTDKNGLLDVYRLDTSTNTWALVGVPAGGGVSATTAGTLLQTGASVYATSPTVVMSGDGDLVLFYSTRSDLVAGDTNAVADLFAKRMSTGTVTRVSTTTTGGNLPGTATGPALALTPDGRFAVFPVVSSTGPAVLYRKTLSGTGAGDAVVVSSIPVSGRATSFGVFRDVGDVAVSDDGRYVALVTAAQLDLGTPGSSWNTGFAYRMDVGTGTFLALGNGQRSTWEHQVELDPTGRYGFFETTAAELSADGNGHTDHYRRDLGGGTQGSLLLVTTDAGGAATAGPTGSVSSAEYGRLFAVSDSQVLVTTSQALLTADTNAVRDLYGKDLGTGAVGSPLG